MIARSPNAAGRPTSAARIPLFGAGVQADRLVEQCGRQASVRTLPGGYGLEFGCGELLVCVESEAIALLASAEHHAALRQIKDVVALQLGRLAGAQAARVAWEELV
ncbi:hypothetical protein [Glycomyces sp. NPDC048151]|uniref:hypothetical protein n=1 Tax=Glycomyces sp. NPDC048151 TaxID=3364002 RepID=UPI00371C69DB